MKVCVMSRYIVYVNFGDQRLGTFSLMANGFKQAEKRAKEFIKTHYNKTVRITRIIKEKKDAMPDKT